MTSQNGDFRPLDSSQVPRYAGPVSFFRLPQTADPAPLDIAVVGVPWDGGTTNRPGPRHAPRELRNQSMLIRPYHHVTNTSPYDSCRVADLGDTPVNPVDLSDSLQRIQDFFARLHREHTAPLIAGGDHLVTLPVLRAIAKDAPVGLVHFDAHTDTNDSYFGEFKFTHGTPMRRAIEEGLVDPKRTIQIGIRGSRYAPCSGEYSSEQGIRVVYIEEFFSLGVPAVVQEIHNVVGGGPAYVSFDVDALDPAFAPGTGTPEVGGMTTFQAQELIRGLAGLNLVGGDVVEVSPPFDPNGVTALVGATIMFEILCVLAQSLSHPERPTQPSISRHA